MSDVEKAAGEWNYAQLALALVVAFVLDAMLLPCMCNIGTAKMQVALVFLALVVLRIVIARLMREKGKGWIFYLVLLYSSPLWIEIAGWWVFGPHR